MVLNAVPSVQGVMALLALTWVVCWAIVFEKVVKLGRASRAARSFETAIKADLLVTGTGKVSAGGLQGAILAAAAREKHDGIEAGESRSDFRGRSEEHTSELQSLMRISYAVFCVQKKKI